MDGFTVVVIRVSDGRLAAWHETYDTKKVTRGTAQFCWQEGNFACDCNRHMFFEEADGREDDDIPCSEGLYSVPALVWDDGEVTLVDPVEPAKVEAVVNLVTSLRSGLLSAQ